MSHAAVFNPYYGGNIIYPMYHGYGMPGFSAHSVSYWKESEGGREGGREGRREGKRDGGREIDYCLLPCSCLNHLEAHHILLEVSTVTRLHRVQGLAMKT